MKITVGNEIAGKIKPLHGVGQPPFSGMNFSMFHFLKEAGIPFVRLHDVGLNLYCHLVDVPFIFRNFDADPKNPASYDFAYTDKLMEALNEYGLEPFYRLGVSIENYAYIKSYYIDPPKDNKKWAEICEGIIRHYNEGWADGYHFNIRYWEIWNEPENLVDPKRNQMWTGTQQQYFDLYETASKHLKSKFPNIKIGGYASCGFYRLYTDDSYQGSCPGLEDLDYYMTFFDDFLAFVREKSCPFDFFSWHSYGGPEEIKICAEYVDKRLKEEGFGNVEQTINEWHCLPNLRGTPKHTATVTAAILAMQDTPLSSAMFYDARFGTSVYGGMFNPLTKEPFGAYYGFLGFNELYKRGNQLKVEASQKGVYAVAASNDVDGYLMIANCSDHSYKLDLDLSGRNVGSCRKIEKDKLWVECPLPKKINKDTVLAISFI